MNFKDQCFQTATNIVEHAKNNLQQIRRTVKAYSPSTILNKGYAIVMQNDCIITNPKDIKPQMELKTILKNEVIHSTVTKKSKNGLDL